MYICRSDISLIKQLCIHTKIDRLINKYKNIRL